MVYRLIHESFLDAIKSDYPCIVSRIHMRIILLVILRKKNFNFDWPTATIIIYWNIEGYSPRTMIPRAIMI